MMVMMVMAPGVGVGGAGHGQERNRQNGGDDAAHFRFLSNHARLRWGGI
jgi:hypothetical protein